MKEVYKMTKFYLENIKEKPSKSIEISIFLIMEIFIYGIFMYLDIRRINISISNVMKYISILICFLFVINPYGKGQESYSVSGHDFVDLLLLRLALFFTLISDYFLLFTNCIIYGLITFVVVQVLYLMRIYRWKVEESIINHRKTTPYLYIGRNLLIASGVLMLLILLVINKLEVVDIVKDYNLMANISGGQKFKLVIAIIILAILYFVSLVLNLIDSINVYKLTRATKVKVFAIGLFLFILCDINVALYNLSKIDVLSYNIPGIGLSSIGMWLFYLPSQVLISLSKFDLGQNQQ